MNDFISKPPSSFISDGSFLNDLLLVGLGGLFINSLRVFSVYSDNK